MQISAALIFTSLFSVIFLQMIWNWTKWSDVSQTAGDAETKTKWNDAAVEEEPEVCRLQSHSSQSWQTSTWSADHCWHETTSSEIRSDGPSDGGGPLSLHIWKAVSWNQLHVLNTSTQQQQSASHPLKHMMTTSWWLLWLADCCLCVSVQSEVCLHSAPQLHWEAAGLQETLDLCFDTDCLVENWLTGTFYWPQSLQAAVWTLHKILQMFHSWILQVVSTQVQMFQIGGVGLQSWGQRITADLWQPAALQSE